MLKKKWLMGIFAVCISIVSFFLFNLIQPVFTNLVLYFKLYYTNLWHLILNVSKIVFISNSISGYAELESIPKASPSYYAQGTLAIVQIFHFRFLADLHVLGSEESPPPKKKLAWCPGVRQLVCQSVETIYFEKIVVQTFFWF